MSNYGQTTNPNAENMNEKNISTDVSNDKLELFKRALSEGLSAKIDKTEEEIKVMEMSTPSKRYKI